MSRTTTRAGETRAHKAPAATASTTSSIATSTKNGARGNAKGGGLLQGRADGSGGGERRSPPRSGSGSSAATAVVPKAVARRSDAGQATGTAAAPAKSSARAALPARAVGRRAGDGERESRERSPGRSAKADSSKAPSALDTKAATSVSRKRDVVTITSGAVEAASATTASRSSRGAASSPVPAATKLVAGRTAEATVRAAGAAAVAAKSTVSTKSAPGSKAEPLPYHLRPIDELWREYRAGPSEALRNFLIEKYLELVRYTAERMHMKLPSEVEVDDLMSAGLFGLMDAIDAFDPDRGVKFETYCTQRIRGAIFDELRAMDWVPRLVRSRTAKVERVRKSLEMESGRKPTEGEIAHRMGVDRGEYEKLQKDSRPVGVVSLNRKWFETDSSKDVREIDVIRDNRQENPVQLVQRQDLQTLITKGLSRSERLIVILYYYEEMTMKEIGMTLDLSESRVSQMHSSILARLKAQMQHRERDF